jgi:nucleotidyltransferase/DNA polymerase involved in DNA repair
LQARIVMLIDLDYFYAQCEERRNPSLKSKPVVVCVYSGHTEDSGAVSTANYVARKYGVKSGIPISLAKQKLKDIDAVFLPVDKEFYREISDKIMEILRSHADRFEQVGIDDEPVQERSEPESLSRISTLKENTRDLAVILDEAYKLCDEVHAKLMQRGLIYRSVSIHIVASDLSVHSKSKTFENPTSDLKTFKKTVKELFEKFLNESDAEARRVGVKVSNLNKKEELQKQLTNFFGSSNH